MPEALFAPDQPAEADSPEMLDDKYIADLIVLSFRYSQGNNELGARILSLITTLHPDRFPEGGIPKGAVAEAVPIVGHIHAHSHADTSKLPSTEENIEQAIIDQIAKMKEYAENPPAIEIPTIAAMIIERDSNFLLDTDYDRRNPGRPPRRHPNNQQQDRDTTFLSHYVYYGLAGNKAGPKEYNELFGAISRPEVIHALPGITLQRKLEIPYTDYTDGGTTEVSVDFSVDRFRDLLRTHFEYYPQDLADVPEAKRVAIRELIGEAEAVALKLSQ